MIQEICNQQHQNNLDTFHKVVIYEASQFPKFDKFTTDQELDAILAAIPETSQVLFANLLPQDIKVSSGTSLKNQLKYIKSSVRFSVTPQTKDRQAALKEYDNKEVFVLLIKRETQHLYGTSKEPLLFRYAELHNNAPGKIKGFSVNIAGNTIEDPRYVTVSDFNIFSRTLAFTLAQKI